jgi:hypothetical protein
VSRAYLHDDLRYWSVADGRARAVRRRRHMRILIVVGMVVLVSAMVTFVSQNRGDYEVDVMPQMPRNEE